MGGRGRKGFSRRSRDVAMIYPLACSRTRSATACPTEKREKEKRSGEGRGRARVIAARGDEVRCIRRFLFRIAP
jgi:hypothetical protein